MSSKPSIKHYGKIVNGVKKYYNPTLYKLNLTELEGQEFEETIKKKHKSASLDQLGFYFAGIVRECLQYEMFFHMTEIEVDDWFCKKFLSYNKILQVGEEKFVHTETRSKSSLSKEETSEFIERCIHWCAEKNIIIKDPEQYELGKYKTVQK